MINSCKLQMIKKYDGRFQYYLNRGLTNQACAQLGW